jgi:hypothetical protein
VLCNARVFLVLCFAVALGSGVSSALYAQAEELRRLFDRTADEEGRIYVVGRRHLEQHGQAILPLLKEKSKADAHRQRDLARALLLRIESPERTALLDRGIDAPETHLLLDKPGAARVELAQPAGDSGKRKTPPVPPEGVTYDRTAVPLLIDYTGAGAVLAEQALWSNRSFDVERLARLKRPEAAFDILLENASVARRPDAASPAVRALALWGDHRAIDELRKLAEQPDRVRPDDLVEAALLVGDPSAAGILDGVQATADKATQKSLLKASAWRDAAALGADVAPAIRGAVNRSAAC